MRTNSRLFRIQVNRDSLKDLWQQASVAPGKLCYGIILSTRTKTRVYAVTTTEGLQCLIKIAGKFPTNLRKHLGKCHSEAFKESEKKEEKNTGSAKVRISHLLPFIIMCKWESVYLFYTNSLAILDLYKYSLFLVYVYTRLLLC